MNEFRKSFNSTRLHRSERRNSILIDTPARYRALTSPVKHEILNAVAAMGPISVAELARMTGRAPTALYRHIAKLQRVGLLVRTESGSKRARPSILYPERASALYHTPSRRLEIDYKLADPRIRKLLARMAHSITATATRNFANACRPEAVVSGYQRTLWASRWKRRLVPREIESLNRHLLGIERLMTQSSRGRARYQPIELTFVLTPAPDKPYRRRRESR